MASEGILGATQRADRDRNDTPAHVLPRRHAAMHSLQQRRSVMNRLWVIVGVATAAIVASATSAGDKKSDSVKFETKEFDKALEEWYGLKLKSHSLVDVSKEDSKFIQEIPKANQKKAVKLLLEVTQDLDANTATEAMLVFKKDAGFYSGRVESHFFDDEGVRIAQFASKGKVEGEIKGKKGEVFRAILPLPADEVLSKTKTVKFELVVPPKQKKLKKE
jgi:hypothetical protein